MKEINQLLNEVTTFNKAYKTLIESSGEGFNIFTLLGVETQENITHSNIIAELLDINGLHAMRNIFMKYFLEYFDIKDFDVENYKIIKEHYIGPISKNYESGGRIDIFIEDCNQKIIMIENKIYAEEQPNQLYRYKKKYPNGILFFLTLDGKLSDDKKIEKNGYKEISYKKDILSWLEQCKKESSSKPILRENIEQYIHLIKKLTNQNTFLKMNQDILNRIIKDDESFQAYITLVNTKQNLFEFTFINNVLPNIITISKKYGFDLDINTEEFVKLSNAYIGFNFSNKYLKSNNLELAFEFQERNKSGLLFGLFIINKEIDNKKIFDDIKKRWEIEFNGIQSNDNWISFKYFDGYKESWENPSTIYKLIYNDFSNRLEDIFKKVNNILYPVE